MIDKGINGKAYLPPGQARRDGSKSLFLPNGRRISMRRVGGAHYYRLLYSSLENDILSVRVYKLLSRLPVAVFCLYIKEKNEPYSFRPFPLLCNRFGVHSFGSSLGSHIIDNLDKFPAA